MNVKIKISTGARHNAFVFNTTLDAFFADNPNVEHKRENIVHDLKTYGDARIDIPGAGSSAPSAFLVLIP
jgi:hypothetical protein